MEIQPFFFFYFYFSFMSNAKKNETICLVMQSYIEFPLGLERT